jgi:hypothetical protein
MRAGGKIKDGLHATVVQLFFDVDPLLRDDKKNIFSCWSLKTIDIKDMVYF